MPKPTNRKKRLLKHAFLKGKENFKCLSASFSTPEATKSPKKTSVPKRSQRLVEQQTGIPSNQNEYIVVNVLCLEDLFFEGYDKHQTCSPGCRGKLQMFKFEHRLLSTSYNLKCPKCKFASTVIRLYRIIESGSDETRGRKSSTLNIAVSNAVINSPIGIVPFRELMLRIGIDPGSETGLQDIMSKHSNDTMIKLAEANMSHVRAELKRTFPEGISVSVDGRYNTAQNSNTPFQAASQSVFSVTENNTEKHQVINVVLESKLCSSKSHRLKAGKDATCPNHEGCTATLKPSDSIGLESRSAFKAAMALKADNTPIEEVTNDGDAEMISAFWNIFGNYIRNLKDPRHFSHAQKRYVLKTEFSRLMFPATTKTVREKHQKWFAEDLRQRCSSEITMAIKKAKSIQHKDTTPDEKIDFIVKQLENTPLAIINCYRGEHEQCFEFSLCCSNKKEGQEEREMKKWPKLFMPQALSSQMTMTNEDVWTLEALILLRLGRDAIAVTYTGSTTQKNEACNRSFTKYNPKTVTFKRNWTGRIHASVLNLNAGFAEAVRQTVSAAGHEISQSVEDKIEARDKKIKYQAQYKKKTAVKTRRITHRSGLYKLHEQKNSKGQVQELGYSKRSNLPLPKEPVPGCSKF